MTRKTTITAAVAAAAIGAAAIALTADDPAPQRSAAAPKIYGASPTAAPRSAPRAPSARDAEQVARRWMTTWDRATQCADADADLSAAIALSGGELARQLREQPPRPGADPSCDPKKLVSVKALTPPDRGAWTVLVAREGETGGPMTLTLQPTDRGLRVVTLNY